MTGLPKRYLFHRPAQWRAGLVTGGLLGPDGLTTAPRLAAAPVRIWEGDAYAPAASRSGEVYWRDGAGALHWLSDANPPEVCAGADDPAGLGGAQRLIITSGFLWAARTGANSVGAYDRRSLQPIADVVLPGTVRDIAEAERQAIAALVDAAGSFSLMRLDERRQIGDIATPGLNEQALQVARVADRWVVAEPARLRWAQVEDPSVGWADLPLTSLGHGTGLAGWFLAAFPPVGILLACSASGGVAECLVVLGPDGEVLDDEALPAAVGMLHGIVGADSSVWLASDTGLWRWDLAAGTGTGEASFLTPVLRSPRGREAGWLRAEIQVDLPPGATIACRIASTPDPDIAQQAQAIMSDPGRTSAAKTAALDALLGWGPPVPVAAGRDVPGLDGGSVVPVPWVLPLHAVIDEFLWLTLHVADGASGTSRISSLTVLYPELSLMQRLPAIYRAAPSSHLRGLVALLDVMAQGLDRRIATLGELLDAASTPDDWLNFLASWLGLPWEPGLPAALRRALLEVAPDLLAKRGTASGIRRLIGVLLPGRPVRISDAANLAPAVLTPPGEGGMALPNVLLGRKHDATRLNVAVLGRTRLRDCGPDDDPLLRLSGWVLIDVSATSAERTALAGPFARLLAGYVPAGLTPILRWHLWPSGAGRRLDEDLGLLGERPGLLGQDIRLGGIMLSGTGPSLRRGLDLSDDERLL
jgi:phage tail-like protein